MLTGKVHFPHHHFWQLLVTLLLIGTRAPTVDAIAVTQVDKLIASDGSTGDLFGKFLAVNADGTRAAISAWTNDEGNSADVGAVYIFKQVSGNWFQEIKLIPQDVQAGDRFGITPVISADGTKVVVGSHTASDVGANSGSIYVFNLVNGTWVQEAKLTPSDPAAGDIFGARIAMNVNGTCILGAAGWKDSGTGAVYVFKLENGEWMEKQKLTASNPLVGAQFGQQVALNAAGDRALIGTSHEGNGYAYMFKLDGDTWVEETKFTGNDTSQNAQFGSSVDLSADGTRAAVGAWQQDKGALTNVGAVYLFKLKDNHWIEEAKLEPSDPEQNGIFSYTSMSADGTRILVGSARNDGSGYYSGWSAYLFELEGEEWKEVWKKHSTVPTESAIYLRSVAISADGAIAMISAAGNDEIFRDAGAVYVWKISRISSRHGWHWACDCDLGTQTYAECQENCRQARGHWGWTCNPGTFGIQARPYNDKIWDDFRSACQPV